MSWKMGGIRSGQKSDSVSCCLHSWCTCPADLILDRHMHLMLGCMEALTGCTLWSWAQSVWVQPHLMKDPSVVSLKKKNLVCLFASLYSFPAHCCFIAALVSVLQSSWKWLDVLLDAVVSPSEQKKGCLFGYWEWGKPPHLSPWQRYTQRSSARAAKRAHSGA